MNRTLNIWCDGAARGNPGPGGIGIVIKDDDGKTIKQHFEFIGHVTNNVAEYTALIKSLNLAGELGFSALKIHMDSELVVKQVNGEYKVKNEGLRPLFFQAAGLLSGLKFSVVHVDREKNKEADKLANEAIDESGKLLGNSIQKQDTESRLF